MPCRSLPLAQGTSLYLSNTVLTVERIENRDTKATGIKPFENIPGRRIEYNNPTRPVLSPMGLPKIYALTKENLELLQKSLGQDNTKESYALHLLLEEQIHCYDENHPMQPGTPSAAETMPTLSSSSVLTPTPDLDETLKLYKQLSTNGNDHPVERFLTPGVSFEPQWFVKRELAALEMPYGEMASLEKRVLLGKCNYSDVKRVSKKRKQT